uniref:chondroadherin-like protein n=1 Tax=Myxine glutinosa TaxID=7769 RepID=UPI00358EF7E6
MSGCGRMHSLMFAIILVTLLSHGHCNGKLPCVSPCNCSELTIAGGSTADCHNKRLISIPVGLPGDTRVLRLGNNNFKKLPFEALKNYPRVESVGLENNQISMIHGKAFAASKKIKLLNLYSNDLHNLPNNVFKYIPRLQFLLLGLNQILDINSYTFTGLESLTDLDMPMNNLSKLPSNVFQHLPKLKILDLAMNKISSISTEAFTGLEELDFLNLAGNKLTDIQESTFASLTKLEMLVLDNNALESLTAGMFLGLKNLRELYVSNNRLEGLPRDTFKHVPRLSKMALNSNRLKSMDGEALSRLKELSLAYLHGNPLVCDCKVTSLLKWLSSSQVKAFPGAVLRCWEPAEHRGKELKSLQRSQLKCLLVTLSCTHASEWSVVKRLREGLSTFFMCENICSQRYVDPKTDSKASATFRRQLNFFGTDVQQVKMQSEIELVEVSRNIREKHKFHNPLLILEFWVVLALFSQEGLDGDSPMENQLRSPPPLLVPQDLRKLDMGHFADIPQLNSPTPRVWYNAGYDDDRYRHRTSNYSTVCISGNNNFKKLPFEALKNYPRVESVGLENNQISMIHGKAFAASKKIKLLNLYSNDLHNLPNNVVKYIPRLQFLLLGLNQILDINSYTLGLNQILDINSYTFTGLESLTDLDMPMNNLSKLPSNVFQHLPKLKILDLAMNKISSISTEAFTGLEELDFLNLAGNKLTDIQESTFASLTKLEMLVLDNNALESLTTGMFLGLKNLRELYVSNNRLEGPPRDTFKHVPRLSKMALNSNRLKSMDGEALSRLKELSLAYLHGNPLVCDCKVTSLLKWLSSSQVKAFPGAVLRCWEPAEHRGKELKSLQRSQLKCLSTLPYTVVATKALCIMVCRLLLITCKIEDFSRDSPMENQLRSPPPLLVPQDLRKLDMGHFADIPQLNSPTPRVWYNAGYDDDRYRHRTSNYSTVCISGNNNFKKLPFEALKNYPRVESVGLENNQISMIHGKAFAASKKIKLLNLYSNDLHNLPNNVVKYIPRLQFLLLGLNQILDINSYTFTGLESLTDLDMPMNNLSKLPSNVFQHLPKLKILDLAMNKISSISTEAFTGLEELDFLNLAGNKLTDIQESTFASLTKLEMLVLGNNALESLTAGMFLGLKNLRELYVSNNRLEGPPRDTFKHVPRLSKMALNSNRLKSMDGEALSRLKELSLAYLHGNPLVCDCKVTSLLKWLSSSQVKAFPGAVLRCWEPAEHRGKELKSLQRSQLKCLA